MDEKTKENCRSQIRLGNSRRREKDILGAVDAWLEAWEKIRDDFPDDVRTCEAADELIGGGVLFFNWTQDAVMFSTNAALEDIEYAGRGARLAEEVLDRFTDESPSYRDKVYREYLELLNLDGEHERAWELVEQKRSEHPEEALWWVQASGFLEGKPDPDPLAAARMLQAAIDYPVRNAADFDLELRFENLRKIYPEEFAGQKLSAAGNDVTRSQKKKLERNDPCWCGSGKKYKKCHLRHDKH